jgi:hypothetical protein
MAGPSARRPSYRLVIANGPPDIDTIVRRRVGPSAGAGRRRSRQHCQDGGPSPNRGPVVHDARRVASRPRHATPAWRSGSLALSLAPLVTQEPARCPRSGRRRPAAVARRTSPPAARRMSGSSRRGRSPCRADHAARATRLELSRGDRTSRWFPSAGGAPVTRSRTSRTRSAGPGEVTKGRNAGRGDLQLERRYERRRHAQDTGGSGEISPRSRPGDASVPRIGTGRVCGTAAGIAPRLIHSTTSSARTSSTTST